jgi:hypothetical protein
MMLIRVLSVYGNNLPVIRGESKLSSGAALEPVDRMESVLCATVGAACSRGVVNMTGNHCLVVRTGSLNSGNVLMHSLTEENFLTFEFFSSGIKYKFVDDRQI